MTEYDILVKFKRGDSRAFKVLYEKYFDLVYYYILSRVNDRLEAEDLAEELFLQLWEQKAKIQIKKSFKSYVLKSAHNRVINYFNSFKTINQKKEESIDINPTIISDLECNSIEHNYLLAQELSEHITEAVNNLPTKCRKIFKLSRQFNYKYSQIAEKLGVSVNTVEKQISIALSKLRNELKEFLH